MIAAREGLPDWLNRLVAGLLLVLTSPLLLVIAVAIRIESTGAVIFRSERVGRGGRPFTILKFRTMRHRAAGPAVTSRTDPRITDLGRFLRSTKLDELPQLVNVIKGEMSIVGPRPEDAKYVERYDGVQRRILEVRPGLISPATLRFRKEEELLAGSDDVEHEYLTSIMPAKLAIDIEWLAERTWQSDVRLLASAVRMLSAAKVSASRRSVT